MAERDDTGKFAEFVPVAAVKDGDGLGIVWEGQASDEETGTAGIAALVDDIGATSWTKLERDENGGLSRGRTYFTSATWRAPWQPTGPRPNWQETGEADPSEPIN